jgi:hypothetical protein
MTAVETHCSEFALPALFAFDDHSWIGPSEQSRSANWAYSGHCQTKIKCNIFFADLGLASFADIRQNPIRYRDLPNQLKIGTEEATFQVPSDNANLAGCARFK